MARKSGFVRRHGRMVRETLWAPIPLEVNTLNTGGDAILIYGATAAEDALRPYTVVRTHLYLSIVSDQLAALEEQICAIGFCIVSDQASAIGVAAVPTPITDLGSDAWYLHQIISSTFVVGDATGFQDGGNKDMNVDSKAMRKVEDGFDNVVTIESLVTVSEGVRVTTGGRQLLKLH